MNEENERRFVYGRKIQMAYSTVVGLVAVLLAVEILQSVHVEGMIIDR